MTAIPIVLLLPLSSVLATADAAPSGNFNKTALHTEFAPAWVNEPEERGTWNILYSCLFTLGLCVYTAIHLNVPGPGERQCLQYLRRVKWVFAAIFAPELGVFSAWHQWCWARKVARELNKCQQGPKWDEEQAISSTTAVAESKERDKSNLQVHAFTMMYS